VHPGDYCQCLERAELVREGTDVTIFCYSRMRYVVMQAVAELEKQGYNPEVGGLAGGRWGVPGGTGGARLQRLQRAAGRQR
jgi:rhodanese-related sulfurtransferase